MTGRKEKPCAAYIQLLQFYKKHLSSPGVGVLGLSRNQPSQGCWGCPHFHSLLIILSGCGSWKLSQKESRTASHSCGCCILGAGCPPSLPASYYSGSLPLGKVGEKVSSRCGEESKECLDNQEGALDQETERQSPHPVLLCWFLFLLPS